MSAARFDSKPVSLQVRIVPAAVCASSGAIRPLPFAIGPVLRLLPALSWPGQADYGRGWRGVKTRCRVVVASASPDCWTDTVATMGIRTGRRTLPRVCKPRVTWWSRSGQLGSMFDNCARNVVTVRLFEFGSFDDQGGRYIASVVAPT
jgi:hypothetical protein